MPNNLKNTEATQFRSGSKAVENGRKGGKKSGQVRREKANLRKMMNMWLDEEHPTKKDGEVVGSATGNQAIMNQIIANAMNPDSKNWAKSIDIILQMSGALITDEQRERQQAEIRMINAKADAMANNDTSALDKLDNIIKSLKDTANKSEETK